MLKPSGIPHYHSHSSRCDWWCSKSAPPLSVSEQKYDQNIVSVSIFSKQTWLQRLEQPLYSFVCTCRGIEMELRYCERGPWF
jgi:hypothetical protein